MEEDDFISKTQRKKRMTRLQVLGADLVRLAPDQLARLALPETLLEAVLECRRLKTHEAIRRQMQYIGRIMRDIDAEPIAETLAQMHAPSRKQTALFHVAERWRDEMLADEGAIDRFLAEFPAADARRVRGLVADAHKERNSELPPRNFRELFHVVNALVQARGKSA